MDIYKHTNSIATSITYILFISDSDSAWLIDCGDVDTVITWAEKNKKIISGVFLTHTHFDHIYGLNGLKKAFPECKVYTSMEGIKGLYNPKLNMSFYFSALYHDTVGTFVFEYENVYQLRESDVVELGQNINMEVFETPGHDNSCLTYKIDNYLFTGDSYIPGIRIIANFPKSNKKDAEESLKKILDLEKKYDLIINAGH
ncbi:MBL fold metallo-hydrolase [Spirochaetia bacterium]|nr:MBL fold metallo-hydrolase [Spirochaetia bacterium]